MVCIIAWGSANKTTYELLESVHNKIMKMFMKVDKEGSKPVNLHKKLIHPALVMIIMNLHTLSETVC